MSDQRTKPTVPKIFSMRQVAEMLGVHRSTISRMLGPASLAIIRLGIVALWVEATFKNISR